MYSSEYFYGTYGRVNSQNFHITDSDIEKIRNLVPRRAETGYYNPQLVWNLENNPFIRDEEELSRLFVCMQFISMIGKPSLSVLDKHNIKDHHMGLLRGLYLEFGDDGEGIQMGYKRPFGNSGVLSDVRDELEKYNVISTDYDESTITHEGNVYDYDNYDLEQKVLEEFVNFLEDFYKDFELPYNSFVYKERRSIREFLEDIEKRWGHVIKHRAHSYLRDWSIDPVLIRDEKIDKILQ